MELPTASEVTNLKERLNKQNEQQCLLEQIVANISSLVEGSGDPMCIFDKDGFFMHVNAACRKLLGITEQHTSQKNIFDYYTSWDRDRVFKESVQRRTMKWSGHVSFIKHGNHEVRTYQVIELLHSSKSNLEGTFFKSYITIQQENATQEKLQVYYEMIRHMPLGVGIWRLEKPANMLGSSLRLVCANSLASQYVGVTLHIGKDIHETLPNGAEVHQFLEEVLKTQRVCTLDKFRTAVGREVAVTAFPLSQDYVAVALESPKKDSWASAIDSACLGVAVCEGMRVLHCNEPFMSLLGNQKDLPGKDVVSLLEQHARPTSRSQLFDLRRAILETRIHHIEVEMEQHKWKICAHPLSDGFKSFLMLAYRVNPKTPPLIHRGTYPILPHLREALPLPPNVAVQSPISQTQSPSNAASAPQSITGTIVATTPKVSQNVESTSGLDPVFCELVENFPCGIAIVKAERHQDITRFRIVSINRAARVFSNHLIIGKYFDERSPSPFDSAFVRLLVASFQTHERRVAGCLNLYGSCLSLAARTIPLRDHCIGIAFEESATMPPQTIQVPAKRSHSEIDCGHQILPSHKHPCISSQAAPSALSPSPSSIAQITPQTPIQVSSSQVSGVHHAPHSVPQNSSQVPTPASAQHSRNSVPLMDIERLPFTATLPKPFLPPIHAASVISGPNSRENIETVFQQCVIGIACCDVKGKIAVVNRSFSQMLGYNEYELVGQSMLSFVSAEDGSNIKKMLHQLVSGELNSVDISLRLLHKYERPVWSLVTLHVNHKAQGERTHVVFQMQQAMRLHKFPEVLFAEPETLRTLFKDLAVGTAILEFGGAAPFSTVCANRVFCDVLGVGDEELAGHTLTDFIQADDCDKITKAAHDIFAARIPCYQMHARVLPRAGTRVVLSLSPIVNSKSAPFLLVLQLQLTEQVS